MIDAATGGPIAGAVVSPSGPSRSTRILTGADGYFLFRNLAAGTCVISAARSGYTPGQAGQRRPGGPAPPIDLADGQRLGDLVVRLWRYGVVTGTVADETGERLVGVQVRAMRRST